jgi:DNA-binding HxlR family transcriptional regulator
MPATRVTRTVTPTVPVTVTYEVIGLDLQRVMCALKAWAEEHIGEVLTHRENYDTRSPQS